MIPREAIEKIIFHEDEKNNLFVDILEKIMLDYGKQEYNQAIDDAIKNAEYTGGGCFDNGEHLQSVPIKLDKKSILKLKKL